MPSKQITEPQVMGCAGPWLKCNLIVKKAVNEQTLGHMGNNIETYLLELSMDTT